MEDVVEIDEPDIAVSAVDEVDAAAEGGNPDVTAFVLVNIIDVVVAE